MLVFESVYTDNLFQVPVIVAENKMDLFRPSTSAGMTDEQALARKRQQIVSLMQQFPFVRQCIKCSAKNLLRVDDVFLKAQQAVLYPFTPPLYDLETGRLTPECKRAFTRIFRMYDRDHDDLLSDFELDRFQRETYHTAVFDRDFAAWKKVVTRNNIHNEVVIQDGKFTVAGFMAIFDVFISLNKLDVVWQALRKFGYDDDLNLLVPDSVTAPSDDYQAAATIIRADWKLTSAAKRFLVALFHQFDSNKDGKLSPVDMAAMFSILAPPALPPWHPLRAPELFEGCFSIPKEVNMSSGSASMSSQDSSTKTEPDLIVPAALSQSLISSSGISILSANDSLPSVDVDHHHHPQPSLTFLDWMGHWHAMAAISPAVARAELFRLGHVVVEDERRKSSSRKSRKKRSSSLGGAAADDFYRVPEASLRSRETRIWVLGSQASGKTALLNALCGPVVVLDDAAPTVRPETSTTHVKLRRQRSSGSSAAAKKTQATAEEPEEEIVTHLVFTDVPESAAASQEEHYKELTELFGATASPRDRGCDLAMLVFDSTKRSSWMYTKELESTLLTKETPRVFVATKADLLREDDVMNDAELHCREFDLEDPLITSAVNMSGEDNGKEREKVLDHLARCALNEPGIDRLRSRPHEEQKRREAARRRKMMWLGGIFTVGVVVAAGLLWGGPAKKDQKTSTIGGFAWIRSWFGSSQGQRV